ncbi:hypothetical protein MHYP_G00070010 [Metynnis hypsauchen]
MPSEWAESLLISYRGQLMVAGLYWKQLLRPLAVPVGHSAMLSTAGSRTQSRLEQSVAFCSIYGGHCLVCCLVFDCLRDREADEQRDKQPDRSKCNSINTEPPISLHSTELRMH